MSRGWEQTFSNWTGRASDAEQDRYDWTKRQVDDALRRSSTLANYAFEVYPKGSYPNFTNVVRDSDVDVAAELTTFNNNDFIFEAEGLTLEDVDVTPYTGDYSLAAFKDDVERALVDHFGSAAVERGKKAIHIHESSQGLAADVVPCVTHRKWTSRTSNRQGIRLLNDANPGQKILNYPRQHLDQGVRKNDATLRRFKRVVRILKRLENEMVDAGVIEPVPSFLIESAVWNCPDRAFNYSTWVGRVKEVLAFVFDGTKTDACVESEDWLEVNKMKFLFFNGQNWTHKQANAFTHKAWNYCGFG
jgi:hypothetical protein